MTEILRFVARITAPLARPLAGRWFIPIWAIVEHQGRRSGQTYRTPVAIGRTRDGFVIPIPFGEGTQWVKNVQAAGGCRVTWKGREFDLVRPAVIGATEAAPAFHGLAGRAIGPTGIGQFLQVHEVATARG